ncbi:MAG: alpha/beta hydrolase [Mesorhizobium sp.]|nr:alpha/beta hydrolase [Mesorhizobium sp.]
MNAEIDSITLPAAAGTGLQVRRHVATKAHGILQINHDLAEHAGRYDDFAQYLARRGFHVYAPDHRGQVAIDAMLFELHEWISREHPGLPVIVFGQGAGALVAAQFLFGHAPRLAGAALWNMPIATDYAARYLGGMLRWERFRLGSDVPSPTMTRIVRGWNRRVGDHRTGFDWLSEDFAVVDAYMADPACGRDPTIGAWIETMRMMSHAGSKNAWAGLPRDLPLHIAGGGDNPVTDKGRMVEHLERRLAGLGFEQATFRHHAGLRHDLVNGVSREPVWRDFADWADAVATSS